MAVVQRPAGESSLVWTLMPRSSTRTAAEGAGRVSGLQRGRGEQRERAQMFSFSLRERGKMFGSWICKENPDGRNHSCSLQAEHGHLWGHGVEGWQGAAPGLGGLGEQGAGGSHPHAARECGSGANQP